MLLSIRKPVAAALATFGALAALAMTTPPKAAALQTTCYYERTTTTYYQGGIMVDQTVETHLLYCITVPS
ncbi:MAG TPA: hypothetical protein VFE05_01620 [Longimicrobiaceae bacterium]|jgi:hypothetical protein|nr:hypothetical protein [Longimicrobiaceae bacterium]